MLVNYTRYRGKDYVKRQAYIGPDFEYPVMCCMKAEECFRKHIFLNTGVWKIMKLGPHACSELFIFSG
jgi:hypothetical protein